jgi:hypothetical protein
VSPQARLVAALARVSSATSALRTREQDAARAAANGGTVADHRARLEAVIARLEASAAELEQALAG